MHVLMLGWEFPPFVTGGLGTACHGLTKAMDRRGIQITFVLPKPSDKQSASHVTVLDPSKEIEGDSTDSCYAMDFTRVKFLSVAAGFSSPYERPGEEGKIKLSSTETKHFEAGQLPLDDDELLALGDGWSPSMDYGSDLVNHVARYAHFCLAATRKLNFDIIHAHDWMTFPAGLWIARATGKPLVVHVHSTEFDRSGQNVNQRVYDIERRGMHGAMKCIAVSQLTKNMLVHRYGLSPDKVEVVYNGVELEPSEVGLTGIRSKDKIVLYFGRITMQKGPEYFIRAAKRVLEVMDNVKFVVAGSGDMATQMIEMAANMGIGHRIIFTGFLRGKDIKRVFSLADLYVMPSVSEPFGIAPLEAMSNDVPVLISKSSGVSEVLKHVLKVDFWDIDSMADKITAVLRHPPLSNTLREHGAMEVRKLTWDGAATRCEQVYGSVIESMATPAAMQS